MKKHITIIVVAFLLMGMLVPAVGAAGKTIEFWTLQLDAFTDLLTKQFKEFEEQTGVHVKWVDVPWGELETKLLVAIGSGSAPDVAPMYMPMFPTYASMGALVNLSEFAKPGELDRYVDIQLKGVTYNGGVYAAPWHGTPWVLIYNKKMFKEAGLDPEAPPRTLDELVAAAKALTKDTDNDGRIDQWGFIPPMERAFISFFWQHGADLLTPDGKDIAFNSPAGIEAAQWIVDLFKKHKVSPDDSITMVHREMVQMFETGRVGMIMEGSWALRLIRAEAPDLAPYVGAAPLPAGKVRAGMDLPMNLAITSQSKNKEAAWEFIKFITNEKNLLDFAHRAPILPSLKSLGNHPFFTENEAPEIRAVIEDQPYTRTYQVASGVERITRELGNALADVILNGKDLKATLDQTASICRRFVD